MAFRRVFSDGPEVGILFVVAGDWRRLSALLPGVEQVSR